MLQRRSDLWAKARSNGPPSAGRLEALPRECPGRPGGATAQAFQTQVTTKPRRPDPPLGKAACRLMAAKSHGRPHVSPEGPAASWTQALATHCHLPPQAHPSSRMSCLTIPPGKAGR